jgi:hypothetical protein
VTVTPNPDLDEPKILSPGRLWSGGVATAVVAGLIVVVGVFIARSILGIPVLAPSAAGSLGTSATAVYAVFAAGCALLATGLLHLLLLGAPQPMTFFTWITALADLVAVVAPFGQTAPLSSKVFTAIINLIVGVAIISLLSGVARSAVRPARPARPGPFGEPPAVPGEAPAVPGEAPTVPGDAPTVPGDAPTVPPGAPSRGRWPGESDRMRWPQDRR